MHDLNLRFLIHKIGNSTSTELLGELNKAMHEVTWLAVPRIWMWKVQLTTPVLEQVALP